MFYQFGFLVFKKPFFEHCLCFLSRESKFYYVQQYSEPQALSDVQACAWNTLRLFIYWIFYFMCLSVLSVRV